MKPSPESKMPDFEQWLFHSTHTTELEVQKILYPKLKYVLNFIKEAEKGQHPQVPETHYMRTRLPDEGDDISFLLQNRSFQKNAARLCGVAYKNDAQEEFASQLEHDFRWDPAFGVATACGVVATYTPHHGSQILVTAFCGTNGIGEFCEYALDYSHEFVHASTLDPRLTAPLYAINTNFFDNYQKTRWRPNLDVAEPQIFIGHSRGGCAASLASLQTAMQKGSFDNLGTFTLGAPPVFSASLAQHIDCHMAARNVNLILEGDIIPHALGWDTQKIHSSHHTAVFRYTGIVQSLPMRAVLNHRVRDYLYALE